MLWVMKMGVGPEESLHEWRLHSSSICVGDIYGNELACQCAAVWCLVTTDEQHHVGKMTSIVLTEMENLLSPLMLDVYFPCK